MSKKILSIFVSLFMVFSLFLPMSVQAGTVNTFPYDENNDTITTSFLETEIGSKVYNLNIQSKSGEDYQMITPSGKFEVNHPYETNKTDLKIEDGKEEQYAVNSKGERFKFHTLAVYFNPPSLTPEKGCYVREYELVPFTPSPAPQILMMNEIELDGKHEIECEEQTKINFSLYNVFYDNNSDTSEPFGRVKTTNYKESDVTWASDNKQVAAVAQNGEVIGINPGTANITVSYKQLKETFQISVKEHSTGEAIYIRPVLVITGNKECKVGETLKLKAEKRGYRVTPSIENEPLDKIPFDDISNSDTTPVTWRSDNGNIAKVDSNGTVTGIHAGTTTIHAECDKFESASYSVTIKEKENVPVVQPEKPAEQTTQKPIEKYQIKISGKSKTNINKPLQLSAVVYNSQNKAVSKPVTWKSSNTKIATVTSSGKVMPKNNGNVTITAALGNAKVTKTIKIWKAKKIKIKGKNKVKVNKKITLKAKITCTNNEKSKAVKWKSSNTKIATVNQKGEVKGKKKGKVKIIAIAKDGKSVKATKKISVIK